MRVRNLVKLPTTADLIQALSSYAEKDKALKKVLIENTAVDSELALIAIYKTTMELDDTDLKNEIVNSLIKLCNLNNGHSPRMTLYGSSTLGPKKSVRLVEVIKALEQESKTPDKSTPIRGYLRP